MKHPNPLRSAKHAIPVAALASLLLFAGMCRQGDEPSPAEVATTEPGAAGEDERALEAVEERERLAALVAAAEERERQAARTAAEAEEEARLAAVAEKERKLAEREARVAEEQARLAAEEARLEAEQERLRRERELRAEEERLAAERAAAEERERRLAEREQELRELEGELAESRDAAPEPLPEPTGTYQGDFDEPWRDSQEGAGEPQVAETDTGSGGPEMDREPELPAKKQVSIQAGERLEVQMVDTLSSATARAGDTFSARLVEDLRNQSGALVVPAGAEVRGRVTEATPYRRGGGLATLGVEFTDIVVSAEQTVGIRASFAELGADRKKNRKKVVAGAVVGAILGHVLGGDGSKSVIIGAAAGAAAGGAMVASAKDRDAEIPGGQVIALQLEEVVTVEIQYGEVAG